MNGMGPWGEDGHGEAFGYGGTGYGAGAGTGGFFMKMVNGTPKREEINGGIGAAGMVYIEWDWSN